MKKCSKIFWTLATALVVTIVMTGGATVTLAQSNIQVADQSWESEFRDHLTFRITAQSGSEIQEADLFYRVVGQLATSRNEADFTPGQSITAEYTIDQTQPANYLPPGTAVEYWWKLTDAAGNELRTDRERLIYLDDRYDWQTLQNDRLTLYWYNGEAAFGQALFERANLALDTLATDIGISLENPIRIFIYGSHTDLLGAISTSAQEWTGGQAFAEHGVVVLGVRPDQLEWGLNAMTHEMSHLVIHQATDNPFGGLPRWLDEGIAVYNENQDELDDDFRPIFEQAVANNELMTLRTLSSPFPADPLEANLAYGQSGAVVKFIVDTYGTAAMAKLLDIFSEGALYDEALEQALGVDTDGLDNAFRASLGLPLLPGTEDMAASAEAAPVVAEAGGAEQDQPVTAEVSAVETDPEPAPAAGDAQPASPAAPETDGALSSLPCLAGLLALLIMAGVVYGVKSS